ncbi:MAG: TetR/AcrR family transcriptional regulator [Candidatus Limnocylindrales bacterium]
MPRTYRLGERATQVQVTRSRIIEAAIALYIEVGISAATMTEVGNRADVAPGTLRNHFPTRDDLDRAMVEQLTSQVPLPQLSMFDGATSLEGRLERLFLAAGVFMDQGRRLWVMWLREPMLTGPWADKGAEYGARWDELMRTAVGPLADDEEAMAILRATIHPAFFDSVRASRRSITEASTLISAVVVPWFAARAARRA